MLDKDAMRRAIGLLEPGEVSEVYAMLKERRRALSALEAAKVRLSVAPGAKVRTKGDIRPAYMAGIVGTVRRVGPVTAVVDFDGLAGRYARGARIPLSMIELALEGDGGR